MHILWICGSRIVGGAERATLQIASLLRDRGHVVSAVCPPGSRLQGLLGGACDAAHVAPIGGALNLRARAAIGGLLSTLTPDVALVTTADEWVWACLGRRPAGTRLVLVRHMALPLAWRVRWLAAQRADAVVAVSQAVRESLCAGRQVALPRLGVIYNPVRFPPRTALPSALDRTRARRGLGLPEDGRWVAFFGGRNRNKGVGDVAHAVRHANRSGGLTHLLLCGRPGARGAPTARALAATFDLGGRLHDLAEIERMQEALTAADVVVMATHRRLSEALPATLIEAMACGTPVLAYATGGMAEVIGADGRAGRLAAPDDPHDLARVLAEILRDPAGAEHMARAALERVRELFAPQHAADRYEALFSALL